MTPNANYVARKAFRTLDQNDQEITVEAALYAAVAFDQIVNLSTMEVLRLPLHIARNPSWYFHRLGDLGHPSIGPKATHEEYVRELVRGNEGLTSSCYWELGALEGWLPCENKVASNASFTATLSKLGFVMKDREGKVVKGIKHGARDCTYHVKGSKKNLDGRFAA